MLVVCGWGVGSAWDSHGESLAGVPGLAWMKIWVGASKVSCNAFFIVYYHPLKRFFCPWGGRKRSNLAGGVFVSSCCCCSQRKRFLKCECSAGFCQPCSEEQPRAGSSAELSLELCRAGAAAGTGAQRSSERRMKRMVLQRSASRVLTASVSSEDLNTVLPA